MVFIGPKFIYSQHFSNRHSTTNIKFKLLEMNDTGNFKLYCILSNMIWDMNYTYVLETSTIHCLYNAALKTITIFLVLRLNN